ncbi:MAG: redox-regulated ATPase YchF [bacterium]|nr:redox-regulated ATPase YchF [bacterium]
MSLKIAIVGLPNVGKSTLFNAMVRGSKAEAANYPFCTIEPNVGIVEVPDERLAPLGEISQSKKIIPAVVEFIDIAGLVRGASKGEGLGNKFLAHIRECDAIGMVVRFFEDANVTHVEGKIDPADDIKTIETELQLADITTVDKRLFSLEKELKSGSAESKFAHSGLQKIKDKLYAGHNAREADLTDPEKDTLKDLSLMTQKPILYVANCGEDQLAQFSVLSTQYTGYKFLPISAKIEAELNELTESEKAEYLETLGIDDSGLNILIKQAYKTLGLSTYFTSGEKETRAWTIHEGDTAPIAAGAIHTDFTKGFIAAEVVPWADFYAQGGWTGAKTHGLVRTEGKTYIVKDGDVVIFRFNV